jgi:thymidylate kinase
MSVSTHFIIGSDGVGKTTILTLLKRLLPAESYVIYDFEERGEPAVDFLEWVRLETQHWVDIGIENQKNNKGTIICGFARPKEVEELFARIEDPTSVILLDADVQTIEERIRKYYSTAEKISELNSTTGKTVMQVIEENLEYSKFLRKRCLIHGSIIIDTSDKPPEYVATEIISSIYK